MKKILIILLIFVFIISLPLTVYAKNEDIFYYVSDVEKIQSIIKSTEKERIEYDLKFIEDFYIGENEKVDPDKLSYDTENIYTWYEWDYDSLLNFMKAENRQEFLDKMPVKSLWFSFYYDGKRVDKRKSCLVNQNGDYLLSGGTGVVLSDKEEIISILASEGITGYDIIQSVTLDGINYAIAQKADETVAIYIPIKKYLADHQKNYENAFNPESKSVYKEFEQQFEKSVFSISEFEKMCNYVEKNTDSKVKNDSKIVGNGGYAAKPFPWKYVGIGAVGLAGTLAIILIFALKKKKA